MEEMIIIKLNKDKEELHLHVHRDQTISDWIETFKIILTWVTFHRDTIDEVFDGTFSGEE